MSSLDRRTFVRVSAAAAAGGLLSACSDPFGPESPGSLGLAHQPKRVVVVGAGLAGLVAAYELDRSGHDVVVLEARPRVGGRVLTLREPFAQGHSAEAGAARVRPEHDLTLGYAGHFGLAMDGFYPGRGSFVELFGGVRRTRDPEEFRARRPSYWKVRGGTDLLPHAFTASLGASVRIGSPVATIDHVAGGVRVRAADGVVYDADRALVTVPLTVLDSITFAPGLSDAKRAAAAGGFRYQAATRVFVRCRTRFWEASGLNGWAETDWPEELWHPTWDVPGPEGALLTYVRGERARELDGLDDATRLTRLLEHWENVFPGVSAEATAAVTHSWQGDPWSRAAWSAPTASQSAELSEEIARAEGPIHFAGEHASGDRGWMQGALASGLRAAGEIHDA